MEKKDYNKMMEKEKVLEDLKRKQEKEAKSYDRIMNSDQMVSNTEIQASVDSSAAEAYEDDFF